ncbi:hypothetical protein SSX86_027821 [Deinandra increscens subsp. villosa]|uniref:Uncharacterized protein n=1 Tax=Deinandra increscens subsp. villosa TaxID=3103831 RepID=A0AAP0GKQ2_9ASTR
MVESTYTSVVQTSVTNAAMQEGLIPNINSYKATATGEGGQIQLTPDISSDQLTMNATKEVPAILLNLQVQVVCDDKGAVEPNKSVFTQDDKDFDHLPNEGGQWYDVPVHSDMHDECHTETTYRVDASNELDVVSPVSVSVVNEVDTRDEDTSDVVVPDVESGGYVARSRPRRNAPIPVRYRT